MNSVYLSAILNNDQIMNEYVSSRSQSTVSSPEYFEAHCRHCIEYYFIITFFNVLKVTFSLLVESHTIIIREDF